MAGNFNIWTALAAGVLSFLSPCILPLVPGYISFVSGVSLEELTRGADRSRLRRKALVGSLFFVAGFSLVFTLLGASASAAGIFLQSHAAVFSKVAGAVIFIFGLHMSGILPISFLYYEGRFQTSRLSPGAAGAFLLGLAFAFGWTPCIGPFLAGVLALAASEKTVGRGMFLLFVYSMGLGIPFILTGLAVNAFLGLFSRYKKFIRWGEILGGVLLMAVGALIFFNRLTLLVNLLPERLLRFAL